MGNVPPGWATDLAVLELTGSIVDDRGDHLVVRTSDNAGFHWGNFVLVTDPFAGDDSERWARTFATEHPAATWMAVGLVAPLADPSAWQALHVELDVDEALTTRTRPAATALAGGYVVRQLDSEIPASPVPYSFSRRAIWLVTLLLTVGAFMNAASSSRWERFGWAPLLLVLAVLSFRLAKSPRPEQDRVGHGRGSLGTA